MNEDYSPEELQAELQRRLASRRGASYSKPMIGNEQTAGIARGVTGGLMTLFGGKAPEEDMASKLRFEVLKNQITKDPIDDQLKQERIKAIQAGLMTDEAGNIIKRPTAPKPMSSYGMADTDMTTPEEKYASLNAENKALIDKVANYDVNPMAIPGMNNQARTELLKLVSALHPDYNQANYATKASTLKDFASGKSADQVQALNTAAKHSGRIQENMDSLHNMDGILAPLNGPKNFIMDTFGGGGPKAATLSINATFDELAGALKKSGATDTTINHLKSRINENMSPEAQKAVLADMANLLQDQETSLQNRYKEGTFKEHHGPFFDQYGQEVLGRLRGGVHSIPGGNFTPPNGGKVISKRYV